MSLRIGLAGLLLLFTVTSVTPGGVAGDEAAVTGTLTYRERIALPADAVITVQLRDVSLMDVAARLVSEQVISPQHAVPVPFTLPYDPADIDERMTYAVHATIRSGERLLFITDRIYPVLTRGQSDQVDLVLVKP